MFVVGVVLVLVDAPGAQVVDVPDVGVVLLGVVVPVVGVVVPLVGVVLVGVGTIGWPGGIRSDRPADRRACPV